MFKVGTVYSLYLFYYTNERIDFQGDAKVIFSFLQPVVNGR